MLRRRHINAGADSRLRAAVNAATWPLREVAWVAEEHILWRLAEPLRRIADIVKWPFERIAWAAERWLVWPLQERLAGWSPLGRIAGAGALAGIVVGAAVLGIAWSSSPDSGGKEPIAALPRVEISTSPSRPQPAARPSRPTLQGSAPVFGVDGSVGVAKAPAKKAAGAAEGDTAASTESATGTAPEAAAATTSSKKPVPAGPVAMKAARRFAEAFVFYEIGKRQERARAVFEDTATPHLAADLLDHPPRLPEGAKVPRARVVNLVAGPRHGKTYTVSASLLRVGVTNELRLEMRKSNGTWLVTGVRG